LKRFWCCSILKCNLSHIVCTVNIIRTKVTFAAGGEKFTAVMPWLAVADESLPPFSAGEYIPMTDVELYQVNVFLKLVF
jgi:hypothetical protein